MVSFYLHHLTARTTAGHTIPEGELRAGRWDPRCTATTVKGGQCRGHIFGGEQEWGFDPETSRPILDDEAWAKFQRGLCRMHRDES